MNGVCMSCRKEKLDIPKHSKSLYTLYIYNFVEKKTTQKKTEHLVMC